MLSMFILPFHRIFNSDKFNKNEEYNQEKIQEYETEVEK